MHKMLALALLFSMAISEGISQGNSRPNSLDELRKLTWEDIKPLVFQNGVDLPEDRFVLPVPVAASHGRKLLVDLTKKGAASIPYLLEHIDDRTLTLVHVPKRSPGFSTFLELSSDVRNDEQEDGFHYPDRILLEDDSDLVLRVGDVCLYILGQIVNRNYLPIRYELNNPVIISAWRTPTIACSLREKWGGVNEVGLLASLTIDLLRPDWYKRDARTIYRLYAIYPQQWETLVVKRLRAPYPNSHYVQASDASSQLSHPGLLSDEQLLDILKVLERLPRSAKLDKEVRRLLEDVQKSSPGIERIEMVKAIKTYLAKGTKKA